MDTAIQNGDFLRSAGGLPVTVCGREELLQRAYLRLQSKRGAFPYDPQLGSRIPLVPLGKLTAEAAMAFVEESLGDDPSLTVTDTTVTKAGVTVTLDTAYGSGTVVIRAGEQGGEE